MEENDMHAWPKLVWDQGLVGFSRESAKHKSRTLCQLNYDALGNNYFKSLGSKKHDLDSYWVLHFLTDILTKDYDECRNGKGGWTSRSVISI